MTNGEKIKEIFPNTKIITQYDNPFGDRFIVFTLNNEDMQVNIEWWNAEYKEPTTKNNLVTLAFSKGTLKYSCKDYVVYKKEWLRNHYGAEIHIMFGDSQYKETTTKNDLSSELDKNSKKLEKNFGELDCISRAKVLKLMQDNWHTHNGDWAMQESMDDIRALPSVTPIRPKGHWIDGYCSECGCDVPAYIVDWKWQKDMDAKFCPNCGAKMIEPQESEVEDGNAD